MSYKIRLYLGLLPCVISILFILLGIYLVNIYIISVAGVILVVSIIYLILTMSLDIFRRDKILDIDQLRKQGLTIVTCNNCEKLNVLEDQFCIFCGEKLGNNDDKLQK